jgi:hypothetical protein
VTASANWLTWVEAAVQPLVVVFSILAGLVLASTALGFAAFARAKGLARAGHEQSRAVQDRCDAAIETMRQRLDALAVENNEARRQTACVPVPKPGFNLSIRSQALRMHRRGETPEQIAAALEVPRQEVDLLLKVHRIVIKNL